MPPAEPLPSTSLRTPSVMQPTGALDTLKTRDKPDDRSLRGRTLALAAGPVVSLLVFLIPIPGLAHDAHRLAAILSCVVCYWVLEPIPLPVTSLLGTGVCVLFGLGSAKSIFASYGHPVIFLFLGSFFLAEAMTVHHVDRRVAAWILSHSWVADRPSRILLALGIATAAISMWISNTAATALMLPIGLGVLGTLREASSENNGRHQTGAMLMLSYAATAGGMATIIGTPPNLVGTGLISQQTTVTISFGTWLVFGLPLAVLMLFLAWGLLLWSYPPSSSVLPGFTQSMREQRSALGSWTAGQINACVAFGTAIVLWVGPGLLSAVLGPRHAAATWLDTHVPNELVALFAAGLLFVLPTDSRTGTFTLSWQQAANINWGILLLFGGGLAFADLIVKTGLADAVGAAFIDLFGSGTLWSLTAVSIAGGVLISELASNTASTGMLVPLVIGIAQASGVSPVPPALGACLGTSLGFMLPVSTPPNAIIYGTGMVPMRSMVRSGVLVDLLGAILIWITLRAVCPLLGLM